jgi:ABC-type uncharacterized transport system involved in gliding motility auxiliary subunit
MMMRMGGGGRTEPWLFLSELKADFDVREIPPGAERIDDDVKVLLVIYPKEISETTEFAIDQFVLRGGKLLAFLDPLSVMDSRADPSNPMQAAAGSGATLEHLLKAWGLEFDLNKVVADKEYFTELGGGEGGRPQINPSFLQVPPQAMDSNDVATSQIERLYLPFSGAFSGTPAEGLKQTVLIRSSANSDLTEKMLAQFGSAQDFKPSGRQYALAVRLDGKFKTAFPNGKPGVTDEKKDEAAEGDAAKENAAKDEAAKSEVAKIEAAKENAPQTDLTNSVAGKKDDAKETAAAKPPDNSLKQSKEDNVVVLIGDADMLHEQFYARVQNFFGQRVMMPFSQNLTLVQNLAEQLGGDKDLISIRSRSVTPRPFTKMRELRVAAEQRFASKIKELEASEAELDQKISELVQGKQAGQKVILSEEAQRQWEDVQKKRAEVREALRMEKRNLQKDIDSLETRLKWTNILLTPVVVAIVGVALAVVKRRRTAAR